MANACPHLVNDMLCGLVQWPLCKFCDRKFLSTVCLAHVTCFYTDKTCAIVVTDTDEVYGIGTMKNGYFQSIDGCLPSVTAISELSHKQICYFASGLGHVLALSEDGKIFVWGQNSSYELGVSPSTVAKLPTLLQSMERINCSSVDCGHEHSVALDVDGKLYSWGKNKNGRTGLNSADSVVQRPTLVTGALSDRKVISVKCFSSGTVCLTDKGSLFSFGRNDHGQLGLGHCTDVHEPCYNELLKSKFITRVECGENHTLVLTNNGELITFGLNDCGQLGDGTTTSSSHPIEVKSAIGEKLRFSTFASNNLSSMSAAVDLSGVVYVWGRVNDEVVVEPRPTSFTCLPSVFASMEDVYKSCGCVKKPDPNTLCSPAVDLSKAFNDQNTSDFEFTVQGKKIYAHKAILKIRSEYFRSLFRSEWKNVTSNSAKITQYSYAAYFSFIKYLYTESIGELDFNDTFELIQFADSMLESKLKLKCEAHIKCMVTLENVAAVYSQSLETKNEDLILYCADFASRDLKEVIRSQSFSDLGKDDMHKLMLHLADLGVFDKIPPPE